MKRAIAIGGVLALFLFAAAPTMAGGRPDKSWKNWFVDLSTGVAVTDGEYGEAVEDAWYLRGGAMLWPEDWAVGLTFTAAWHQSDFKRSVIDQINDAQPSGGGTIDGGDVEIWSLQSNVVWGPKTGGTVGFYLTGGIGVDFLEARITSTGLVVRPPFCSWGWCWPGSVGPGTIVEGRETATEFSYNAGLGIDFELNSGTKLYLEATYHTADTDGVSTDYIPIVFGVRF